MGQRSQIIVRYQNKEKVVARHLQWNYGFYMVNRTYQLLDYIKKSANNTSSELKKTSYTDIVDKSNESQDILKSLIELNLTIGSCVKSYDLIKGGEYETTENGKFRLDPFMWDNNNGWLIIDIQNKDEETYKIKYCLIKGYEELGENQELELKPCSIREYYNKEKDYNWNNNFDEEDKKEIEKQLKYIDDFQVMTKEELDEVLSTEYEIRKGENK